MRLILSQLDLDPHAGLVNLLRFEEEVRAAVGPVAGDDVLLLPELVGSECAADEYEAAVAALAGDLGCHVVGGSHYPVVGESNQPVVGESNQPAVGESSHPVSEPSRDDPDEARRTNRGCVATPDGHVLARYEKQNPYGVEHATAVVPGDPPGCFRCGERTVAVLLCADFWFSRVFHALPEEPDVVLVPAFSVSQKPDPAHPRALWRHMSVARAYEFGAFVGVSDWAHPVDYQGVKSSGVAGLAAPNPPLGEPFFRALSGARFAVFALDFDRLDDLRENRRARGFV